MNPEHIAELSGTQLDMLLLDLTRAARTGSRVRFNTTDGGLKWAVGGETWTPPYGTAQTGA